jgi:hypothetical protein
MTRTFSSETARHLRSSGLLILLLAAIVPWIDVSAGLWPFHWDVVTWRYGAFGTLSGLAIPTAVGLFAALALAAVSESRGALWFIAVLSAVTALLLVIASGLFALDIVQTRKSVPAAGVSRFDFASLSAILKLLLITVAQAMMAWACVRLLRQEAKVPKAVRGSGSGVLIGRSETPGS